MIKELTLAEQMQLRWLISARRHPDRIETYLAECGCSAGEIEEIFEQRNLTRSHLLDAYRMKRNVRIVGVLIILLSVLPPTLASGGALIGVSIGPLALGVGFAVTGSWSLFDAFLGR